MGTQSIPPVEDSATSRPNGQIELFQFMAEEARKNRDALHAESQAVRDLFIKTSQIIAIPLTAAIALAGIFFFHNLNEMKQAMVDEGRAEAKLEIQKMEKHIDDTLEAQFATEKIHKTIQQAAQTATREQAPALIRGVVTPEVRKAVERQSGTIKGIAVDAATKEVKNTIDPIADDLKVEDLITRANADDAKAFDRLLQIRDSAASDQRGKIETVIADRVASVLSRIQGGGDQRKCLDPESPQVQGAVESHSTEIRKAALGNCFQWVTMGQVSHAQRASLLTIEANLARTLVDVAMNDSSLSVRGEAIFYLNTMFASSPGFPPDGIPLLETEKLKTWWRSNKDETSMLLLLARVGKSDSPNSNSVDTYDEILTAKTQTTPTLAHAAEEALSRMRSFARRGPEYVKAALPADFKPVYGPSSCPKIISSLRSALPVVVDQPNSGGTSESDGFVFSVIPELEYVKSCPVDRNTLAVIADYAANTASLSGRYESVQVIDKYADTKIDPFDTKVVQGWWAKHKSEYAR